MKQIIFTFFLTIFMKNYCCSQTTELKVSMLGIPIDSDKNLKRHIDVKGDETCGFFSKADSNFYDCSGISIYKIDDPLSLKDGAGCCQNIKSITFDNIYTRFIISGEVAQIKDDYAIIKNNDEVYYLVLSDKEIANLRKVKNKSTFYISIVEDTKADNQKNSRPCPPLCK